MPPFARICGPSAGCCVDEVVEHLADAVADGLDLADAADLAAKRRRDANRDHACTGPWQNST